MGLFHSKSDSKITYFWSADTFLNLVKKSHLELSLLIKTIQDMELALGYFCYFWLNGNSRKNCLIPVNCQLWVIINFNFSISSLKIS